MEHERSGDGTGSARGCAADSVVSSGVRATRPASPIQKMTSFLLLGAVIVGLNFHLVFLQFYGWGGMVLDIRENTASWSEAARQALSGEAPCSVCNGIDTALRSTDESSPSSAIGELPLQSVFLLLSNGKNVIVRPPGSDGETIHFPNTLPSLFAPSPPAPPPRIAVV